MTFIVVLIALLIERFFDWSHLRHWSWYGVYQQVLLKRLIGQSPYVMLAAILIPLLLVVLLCGYLINGALYGLLTFLFNIVILLYCLGPQNLWADAFACLNALKQGDKQLAAGKLKTVFGIAEEDDWQVWHKQFIHQLFVTANRRVFAVVFWYMVLGPVGAILYRANALLADAPSHEEKNALVDSAQLVEAILDWLPVRVFTFIFALGGHFMRVFECWHKKLLSTIWDNNALLVNCGVAALDCDDASQLTENAEAVEKSAINLIDRVFVIVLVIIAISNVLM